jgi:hypothetical protein
MSTMRAPLFLSMSMPAALLTICSNLANPITLGIFSSSFFAFSKAN